MFADLENEVVALEEGEEFVLVSGEVRCSCGAKIIMADVVIIRSCRGDFAVFSCIFLCEGNPRVVIGMHVENLNAVKMVFKSELHSVSERMSL